MRQRILLGVFLTAPVVAVIIYILLLVGVKRKLYGNIRQRIIMYFALIAAVTTVGTYAQYARTHNTGHGIERSINQSECEIAECQVQTAIGIDIDVKCKYNELKDDKLTLIIAKKGEDSEEFSRDEFAAIDDTIRTVFSPYDDYRVYWKTPVGN